MILTGVRWSGAYPLNRCPGEELRQERGAAVDHTAIRRCVLKEAPPRAETVHRRKRPVRLGWRVHEPTIEIEGRWRTLCRAVDKTGQAIDFLPAQAQDEPAVPRFLTEAIRRHGVAKSAQFGSRPCAQTSRATGRAPPGAAAVAPEIDRRPSRSHQPRLSWRERASQTRRTHPLRGPLTPRHIGVS